MITGNTTPLNRNNLKLSTVDWAKGKGGGITLITKNHYQVNLIARHNNRLNSFECTTWKITAKNSTFTLHCVYHPPYSLNNKTTNAMFIDEFTDFASMLIPDHINNIFIGDFNLHVSDPNDTNSAIFNDTIEAMGLLQHVGKSTHKSGNMLDLIISEIQGDTTIRTVNTGPYLSDHCAVIATLRAKRSNPNTKIKLIRGISKITEEQWCSEFKAQNVELTDNLDNTMASLNTELKRVLDTLAPEKEKKVSLKTKKLWYDSEMVELKRKVCKLEKKWMKYRLDSLWQTYKKARNSYYYLLNNKKRQSLRNKIMECSTDSKKLHQLINNLTKPDEEVQWPEHSNPEGLANKFVEYFENKILKIRNVLEDTAPYESEPKLIPKLSRLAPMMEKEVSKIIASLKTKSCKMDAIPTDILKKLTPVVLPLIVKIINLSLMQGEFCRSWKTAMVRPLLKKTGLSTNPLQLPTSQ